jgi:hypothetical protein
VPACSSSPCPRSPRHALGAVLAAAVAAVLGNARSLAAIGGWAADAPGQVLAALGCGATRDRRLQATRGGDPARVLAFIDPDALDHAIGAWLAASPLPAPRLPPAPRPPRRAVAVDGKTLRGSGHHPRSPVHLPWRDISVLDHTCDRGHGRVEIPRLQVTTVAGLGFPHATHARGTPAGPAR